jgi:hypothetical protein
MLVQATQHFETIEDAQDSLTGLQNLPDFVLGYILQTTPKIQVVFIVNCTDSTLCRGQRLVTTIATKS